MKSLLDGVDEEPDWRKYPHFCGEDHHEGPKYKERDE